MRTATIYMIKCNTTNLKYYGSTYQVFNQRKHGHIRDYKRWCNNHIKPNGLKSNRTTACNVMKNNDYEFHILDQFEIDDGDENLMHKREADWILNNSCVNKVNPITKKFFKKN